MTAARRLGTGGPEVGPVGFGAMGLSWAYGPAVRQAEATAVIDSAVEAGCTLIDTADMYGPYTNEELVGKALSGRRSTVTLATKCGLVVHDAAQYDIRNDGRPEHVAGACEASLARLGVEAVDLLYLHRVDPVVPVEETWGAMAKLVREGKARAIGISEPTLAQLDAVAAIHPIAAVQSELSLWSQEPVTGGVLAWCAEHGAAFVPYSPLGRGLLTGTVRRQLADEDFRSRLPRFEAEALDANVALADRVAEVAERLQATAAQVALAWTLHLGEHVIPIPGTRRSERVRENAAAADLLLTADDLQQLQALPVPTGARR